MTALRKRIECAFSDVPYPGDHALVYDTSGCHLECNQVAEALRGKHWRELDSVSLLLDIRISLAFLSPEAFRFYLPGLMLGAIEHFDETDTLPDSVVFFLTPPTDARDHESFSSMVSAFDDRQRQAIREFLLELKDKCGDEIEREYVNQALKQY